MFDCQGCRVLGVEEPANCICVIAARSLIETEAHGPGNIWPGPFHTVCDLCGVLSPLTRVLVEQVR